MGQKNPGGFEAKSKASMRPQQWRHKRLYQPKLPLKLMRLHGAALLASVACVCGCTLLGSCDDYSFLLTSSEFSSLYTAEILHSDGTLLSNGDVLGAHETLMVNVGKKPKAPPFDAIRCDLEAPGSAERQSLLPQKTQSFIASGDPSGELPKITVPSGLLPGLYAIELDVVGPGNRIFLKHRVEFFLGQGSPAVVLVSSFPPSVPPNESVLIILNAGWRSLEKQAQDQQAEDKQPMARTWVRWSLGDLSLSEGSLSEGFDRVVWKAPRVEGLYNLSVELFPLPPPTKAGFDFVSPYNRSLAIPVQSSPLGYEGEFSNPLAWYSLLRFNGNFSDTGTRMRDALPRAFGNPEMDVYAHGFGYRFGSQSGLEIPGLMPLVDAQGEASTFCVLFNLDYSKANGDLIAFKSPANDFAMTIRIRSAFPQIEIRWPGHTDISTSTTKIETTGSQVIGIGMNVEGDRYRPRWIVDGNSLDCPELPIRGALPASGVARLGGADALPGIYDDFGLSWQLPPLFRLAQLRKLGPNLILAEAFEDGELPPFSQAVGDVRVAPGLVTLGEKARLRFEPEFDLAIPVSFELASMSSRCVLHISGASEDELFSLLGDGQLIQGKQVLGKLHKTGKKFIFVLKMENRSIFLEAENARFNLGNYIPGQLSCTISQESSVGFSTLASILAYRSASSL